MCFHRELQLINKSVSFPHEAGVENKSVNAVDSDFIGCGSIQYGFSGNASSAAKWQGKMFLIAVKLYQQANWDPLSPTCIPDAQSTSLPLHNCNDVNVTETATGLNERQACSELQTDVTADESDGKEKENVLYLLCDVDRSLMKIWPWGTDLWLMMIPTNSSF